VTFTYDLAPDYVTNDSVNNTNEESTSNYTCNYKPIYYVNSAETNRSNQLCCSYGTRYGFVVNSQDAV